MSKPCPACSRPMQQGLRDWHLQCPHCRYESSSLQPHIQQQAHGGDLDEAARETGLAHLRQSNFRRLAEQLRSITAGSTKPLKLLDVGCAHGWFLEATRDQFDGLGIEPDVGVASAAAARGLPIRNGFFPDVLDPEERFDVIVFNDVLEHIDDLPATLSACANHLAGEGLLVVNAPSSRGFLYRLSKLLARVGAGGPFERMWQLGFPSPHVHYLDTDSLVRIAGQHGFILEQQTQLPSVALRGLYARVRYSRDTSAAKAVVVTGAVTAAWPLLAVLPPDIKVWFLRRQA